MTRSRILVVLTALLLVVAQHEVHARNYLLWALGLGDKPQARRRLKNNLKTRLRIADHRRSRREERREGPPSEPIPESYESDGDKKGNHLRQKILELAEKENANARESETETDKNARQKQKEAFHERKVSNHQEKADRAGDRTFEETISGPSVGVALDGDTTAAFPERVDNPAAVKKNPGGNRIKREEGQNKAKGSVEKEGKEVEDGGKREKVGRGEKAPAGDMEEKDTGKEEKVGRGEMAPGGDKEEKAGGRNADIKKEETARQREADVRHEKKVENKIKRKEGKEEGDTDRAINVEGSELNIDVGPVEPAGGKEENAAGKEKKEAKEEKAAGIEKKEAKEEKDAGGEKKEGKAEKDAGRNVDKEDKKKNETARQREADVRHEKKVENKIKRKEGKEEGGTDRAINVGGSEPDIDVGLGREVAGGKEEKAAGKEKKEGKEEKAAGIEKKEGKEEKAAGKEKKEGKEEKAAVIEQKEGEEEKAARRNADPKSETARQRQADVHHDIKVENHIKRKEGKEEDTTTTDRAGRDGQQLAAVDVGVTRQGEGVGGKDVAKGGRANKKKEMVSEGNPRHKLGFKKRKEEKIEREKGKHEKARIEAVTLVDGERAGRSGRNGPN